MSRIYRLLPSALFCSLLLLPGVLAHPSGDRAVDERREERHGADQRGGKRGGDGSAKPATAGSRQIAVVNGVPIDYRYYDDLRGDQLSFQRRGGRAEQIDQQTDDQLFLQLVDAEIIRQEAAKRGIAVSRDEAVKLIIEHPPAFMRDNFVDDKGVFQKDFFTRVVRDPSQMAQYALPGLSPDSTVARWREDLDKVIRFVQNDENRRRLEETLYKEKPLTAEEIKARYFAESTHITGSFVRVLHSTIPDSLAPVSEAESRAWYAQHKEEYRVPAARWVSTAILTVNPTAADSATQRKMIDSVAGVVRMAPLASRGAMVGKVLRGMLPNRFPSSPIMARQLPEEAIPMMRDAKAGDLVGPVQFQDESVYFYVDEVVPATDTVVRASHVLMRADGTDRANDSVTYELMMALKGAIKSSEQFAEAARVYGQDGSASKGGDLGYFGRGKMFREFDSAAFAGNVGEIVGPVRTRFGYHLIRITDKLTNAYRLRELRFPLVPSRDAEVRAEREAQGYAEVLKKHGDRDSAVASLRAKFTGVVFDTSLVRRLDPYGDALATTEFAFNAGIGDVGVIPLPYHRVAVLQVLKSWPAGIPKYEEIPIYPISHARRAKQLDMLKPRIDRMAHVLTTDMLIGPMREIAPMAEVFLVNNQIVNEPPDESPTILDSLVMVTPHGAVSGPVRGTHGYYFLRVQERNGPSEADYQRDRDSYTAEYTKRYRTKLVDDLIAKGRAYAELTDNRPMIRTLLQQASKGGAGSAE